MALPKAATGTVALGTRERIIAAALELFAERGFASTTTAEIARSSGVAEKTLYAHFKSKEALFEQTLNPAAIQLLAAEHNAILSDLFNAHWDKLEDFLFAVMDNRLRLFRQHPSKFKFIVQELLLRPELASPFTDKFRCHIAPLFESALLRLKRQGQLRAVDPSLTHRMLNYVLLGYAVQRLVLRPEAAWNDEEELRSMISALASGLKPKKRATSKS